MRSASSIRVRRAETPGDVERAFQVRRAVFIEEQGVPEAIERDEHDTSAVHVMALKDEEVIGTGRLAIIHGVPRIGRMAVLKPFRGQGVGAALLHALLEAARSAGHQEVHLAAQLPVEGFYAKLRLTERFFKKLASSIA